MKRFQKKCTLFLLLIGLGLSALHAQSYDKLWKQVEQAQKKSLPQTVIKLTGEIYQKAEKEKNAPQMLKATIYRDTYQEKLTPDSPLRQSEKYGILGAIGTKSGEQSYLAFTVGT